MHDALAIVSGLVGVVSVFPYLLDTVKGKTHPNVVTWFVWTLLNGLICLAALSGHAIQTAIFSGIFALSTASVVAAGLRTGVRKYTGFDIGCFVLAICGVVAWKLTSDPSAAVLFNLIADLIGVLPTYRHAWMKPTEETWQAYAIGGLSAIIGLASIQLYGFLSTSYPAYLLASDLFLVFLILYRRGIGQTRQAEDVTGTLKS